MKKAECFTISVVEKSDDPDSVLMITEGVEIVRRQVGEKVYEGLQIGCRVVQKEVTDELKILRVKGTPFEEGVDEHYSRWLTVGEPDERGLRFIRQPREQDDEDPDQILVHLDFLNPNLQARMSDSRPLRMQHLLYEGKVQEHETKWHRFSCPGVLLVQIDEEYSFSFWSPVQRKALLASFHFDGTDLVITEVVPKPPRAREGQEDRPYKRPFNGVDLWEHQGYNQQDTIPDFPPNPNKSRGRKERRRDSRNHSRYKYDEYDFD